MAHANSRVLRRFQQDVMDIPEIAEHIYDAVRGESDSIVPVALPELRENHYYPGHRFKIAEDVTRILFVRRAQPFRIESIRSKSIGSPESGPYMPWWYYVDRLCINALTNGLLLRTGRNPGDGIGSKSVLIQANRPHYDVAGRMRRAWAESEATIKPDVRCSIADSPGLDRELSERALVGWEAVSKLSVARALPSTTLGDFCRATSQIPPEIMDEASEAWGVPFDPEAGHQYRDYKRGLSEMQQHFNTDWAMTYAHTADLVGA